VQPEMTLSNDYYRALVDGDRMAPIYWPARHCQVDWLRRPMGCLRPDSVRLSLVGDQASADARVTSFQIWNRLQRSSR